MPIDIKPATFERVPDLARLLGRAFADDPMFLWPLGFQASVERLTGFFRAFDERLSPSGLVWEAGDGAGVAGWVPPGSDAEMMEIDRELRPEVSAYTDDGGTKYEAMWEWIAGNFPEEPFWYLDHIAVEAEQRGGGVGTALIQHGTRVRRSRRRARVPGDRPARERRVLRAARVPNDLRRRTLPAAARTSGSCATTLSARPRASRRTPDLLRVLLVVVERLLLEPRGRLFGDVGERRQGVPGAPPGRRARTSSPPRSSATWTPPPSGRSPRAIPRRGPLRPRSRRRRSLPASPPPHPPTSRCGTRDR